MSVRRIWHREKGQNLVELALLLPMLLLILLGILDFSRAFYAYIGITNAAREGARYGSSNPGNLAGITSAAVDEAGGLIAIDPADVAVSYPNGGGPGQPVIVTVAYSFSLITPFMGNVVGNPLELRSSATMAIGGVQ